MEKRKREHHVDENGKKVKKLKKDGGAREEQVKPAAGTTPKRATTDAAKMAAKEEKRALRLAEKTQDAQTATSDVPLHNPNAKPVGDRKKAVVTSNGTTPAAVTAEDVVPDPESQAKPSKAERKAVREAAKADKKAAKEERRNQSIQDSAADPKVNGGSKANGDTNGVAHESAPTGVAIEDPKNSNLAAISDFSVLPGLTKSESVIFKSFTSPTPIQASTWPHLLADRDLIGVAETGSGKTLAFALPCIRRLTPKEGQKLKHVRAVMISPTRELAIQIHDQVVKLAEPVGIKVVCVYGGVDKESQREKLKTANIIVATPGRLNDLINEGHAKLEHVNYLVLDEADRMLEKGFEEDIRRIIGKMKTVAQGRQTSMFTATWPQSVRELANTFMANPVKVIIGDNNPTGELRANTRIVQKVEVMDYTMKNDRLLQLLKQHQSGKKKDDRILVFCLYKKEATRIEGFIQGRGFRVAGINGDMSQSAREASLESFKSGKVPILVATDVAARGLDIPAVKVVINVTFPLTAEDYVHRIGRTGRAGQDGLAYTFFTDHEKGLAGALINVLKAAGQVVPEELLKFGTTVKRKEHGAYGAFYKETEGARKATKITF